MTPNIQSILQTMSNVVADVMRSYQSDFTDYDRPYIENEAKFPMIWIVSRCHTFLLRLGEYESDFNTSESTRYLYAQNGNPYQAYLDHTDPEKDFMFLITEDAAHQINMKQAQAAVKDIVTPVVERWKQKHGPLPKRLRVPVKIHGIKLHELKAFIRNCEEHNDDSLINALRRLHRYTRVGDVHYITLDWYPHCKEFEFTEYHNGKKGLNGFIVFHGWPETGYMVNGSVQIFPRYGWQMHT